VKKEINEKEKFFLLLECLPEKPHDQASTQKAMIDLTKDIKRDFSCS